MLPFGHDAGRRARGCGGRLDAAIVQAVIEANDRWRPRLLDQLADTDTGDDRLAAALAEESAAVRERIRQIDAVLIRIRGHLYATV